MASLKSFFSLTSLAAILGQLMLISGAPVNEDGKANLGPRTQVSCIAGYVKVSTLYPPTHVGWIGGDNSVVSAQSSAAAIRVDAWDTITRIRKQNDAASIWSLMSETQGGFLHMYSADYARPVFGPITFPPQTLYPGTNTVAESIVWTVKQATNEIYPTWTNPAGTTYPTWVPKPFVHSDHVYFGGGLDKTDRAHFGGNNTANVIVPAGLEFEPIPNALCAE